MIFRMAQHSRRLVIISAKLSEILGTANQDPTTSGRMCPRTVKGQLGGVNCRHYRILNNGQNVTVRLPTFETNNNPSPVMSLEIVGHI